jgi:hypothetical protein
VAELLPDGFGGTNRKKSPNYAALDQLDAKGAPVVVKHYGSWEAAFESAKKRAELREVIASHLAREVSVK